jgi:predicted dehydrogenase
MIAISRRSFLERGMQGAAAGILSSSRAVSASDKVIIGLMGVGGRGTFLAKLFASRADVEIAYVCDVNNSNLEAAAKGVEELTTKRPKSVSDFRRMLDDVHVDAIVNATPEHWHGLGTIMACQAGKDVYVEKPASHNIWEGRKMVEAARKYKRVVQVGTQNRSAAYARSAQERIRSGKLGSVHLVRVFNMLSREPVWKAADTPVPAGFDWDMYLGPAADRPYNPVWRKRVFWDLDGGNITDDGIHQLDLARWIIGESYPKSVHHSGGNLFFKDAAETQDTILATYEYGSLRLVFEASWWTPYMKKTPQHIRDGDLLPEWYPFNATRIEVYGSKGMMLVGRHGGGWQIYEADGQKGPFEYGHHTKMQMAHVEDFVNCIRSRKQPNADIEEGHISAALCHLANISYRVGNRKLVFDAATETFVNDKEADRYLKRTYRKPWVISENV